MDIGCTTSVVLNGNVPQIGTPLWEVVGVVPGTSLSVVNATAVLVTGISGPITMRYSIVLAGCPPPSVGLVNVKRYNEVSAPSGTESNMSIGCQSSFFIPSDVPLDGYGKWDVTQGSGSVVQSLEVNGTAVTSVSTLFNAYTFSVSGLGCVSKTAFTTVYKSDPTSVECVGCQIVSLGKDANGNETFVNTCDPPVPLVITNTDKPIEFTVEITMKSLDVGGNADVVFNASVTLTGTMSLGDGSTVAIGGNNLLTVETIDARNSSISLNGGGSIIVKGNITSTGATFTITAGNMTISGSVAFDNATVFSAVAGDAGSLFVEGEMSFGGRLVMAILRALVSGGTKRATSGAPIEVVRYGSAKGSFGEIAINIPSTACEIAETTPNYGPSSMSITVAVRTNPSCDAGSVIGVVGGGDGGQVAPATATQGLSSEAIVGLVVSLVLVASAVMVVLVLVAKARRLKTADKQFREQQKLKHKSEIQMQSVVSTDSRRPNRSESVVAVASQKLNPAFGKEIDSVTSPSSQVASAQTTAGRDASQPSSQVPYSRPQAFTAVFNASTVDIPDKEKEEDYEGGEGDELSGNSASEETNAAALLADVDALPEPIMPVVVVETPVSPRGVRVVATNNGQGFNETPAADV